MSSVLKFLKAQKQRWQTPPCFANMTRVSKQTVFKLSAIKATFFIKHRSHCELKTYFQNLARVNLPVISCNKDHEILTNSGKINECLSSASVWRNRSDNYFKTVTLAHFNDRKKILSLFSLKEINVFDFIFQIQESK